MIEDDKPSIDEVMKHHGIKGMHWGVRKQHESSGGHGHGGKKSSSKVDKGEDLAAKNELQKKYMAVPPIKRSPKEAAKALADSEAKSHAKLGPSLDENAHKHMSPEQKAALKKAIAGAIVIGGLVALSRYGTAAEANRLAELKALSGQPISATKFSSLVTESKMKSWGMSGYIQESSHLREEFTLPAGHTMHRISTYAEDSYSKGTYATHNIDDFNRYVSVFRHEKYTAELHHITFQTTQDLKVPNLATTLETLREVMSREADAGEVSHKVAMDAYQSMSGATWSSGRAVKLFDALKEKGYGAIVDEMDAGVIGESPVVVFAHEHLTPKVVQPLTKDMIDSAESSLIELANRKL